MDGRWLRGLSWICVPRNNCFITWMSYLELSWCDSPSVPVHLLNWCHWTVRKSSMQSWKTQGNQSLKVLRRLQLLWLQSKAKLKDKVKGLYPQYVSSAFSWQLQAPHHSCWPSNYRCKMGIVKMMTGFHLTVFIWSHFWIKSFLFVHICSLACIYILHIACQYLQIYLIK